MRKLLVKLKPNTENKMKWYYSDRNNHMLNRSLAVREEDDEPFFDNSYRFGHGGSYFISKDDCIILDELT